ncbi:hypothetical protein C0995_007238 [Termitomyces sp. Mi166|nr:hypothetical protein C0995_007238 [Termitomyces sp. Mi166\
MSQPPYYILFSHSSVSAANSGSPSSILGHPTIQYNYANDSPSVLWPQHANEHVLVLDYPHSLDKSPTVQSLSKDLAVTSLKIEDAPGAAATGDSDPRNDKMYIIETTATDGHAEAPVSDRKAVHDAIAQFKRRNAIIRRALLYPDSTLQQTPMLRSSHPQ